MLKAWLLRKAEARAKKGAALLDRELPAWWGVVDLGILDLTMRDDCVLGQLYGDYFHGRQKIGLFTRSACIEYGFVIGRGFFRAWRETALRASWETEIMRRRNAEQPYPRSEQRSGVTYSF